MTKFIIFSEEEIELLAEDSPVIDVDKDGNRIIYLSEKAFDTYRDLTEEAYD